MDFSFLSTPTPAPSLPDPVEEYQRTLTLKELARRDRENALVETQKVDLDTATKAAQQIFKRAQEVGWDAAIEEGAQINPQGAQIALKAYKEQQGIDNEQTAKLSTAMKARADAAKTTTENTNLIAERFSNEARYLSQKPNLSPDDVATFMKKVAANDMQKVLTPIPFQKWTDPQAARDGLAQASQLFYTAKDKAKNDNDLQNYSWEHGDRQATNAETVRRDTMHNDVERGTLGVAQGHLRQQWATQDEFGTNPLNPYAKEIAAKMKDGGSGGDGSYLETTLSRMPPEERAMIERTAERLILGDDKARLEIGQRLAANQKQMRLVNLVATKMVNAAQLTPADEIALRSMNSADQRAFLDRSKNVAAIDQSADIIPKQINTVRDIMKKAAGPIGSPYFDNFVQKFKSGVKGDPDVDALRLAIFDLSREATRLATAPQSAGQLHVQPAELVDSILNWSKTPEQFEAIAKQMVNNANNIKASGHENLDNIMSRVRSRGLNNPMGKTAGGSGEWGGPGPSATSNLINEADAIIAGKK
jgi:hypothetical protein